jgi:hypothetical protein
VDARELARQRPQPALDLLEVELEEIAHYDCSVG